MSDLTKIIPPFPTDKNGSFVSRKGADNPIQIQYYESAQKTNMIFADIKCDVGTAGPPGHVHGGCMAAILDELMGTCAWQAGHAVVAAEIKIQFHDMLPLNIDFKGEAKIEKIEGRKIYTSAKIFLEDRIFSSGSGLFLILKDEKIEQLKKFV